MGDLSERQTRYLLAAFDAAPNAGDSFDYRAVGKAAGFPEAEAKDLLVVLGNAKLVALRYGNTQTLTPEGRELSRWIRDNSVRVSLSEQEQVFLLTVADAEARQEELSYESAADDLGISRDDAEAIRAKLLNASLVEPPTFGTLVLTDSGRGVAERLRQHRARAEAAAKDAARVKAAAQRCKTALGQLSPRQQSYLLRAFKAAPNAGDTFNYRQLARSASVSQPESHASSRGTAPTRVPSCRRRRR